MLLWNKTKGKDGTREMAQWLRDQALVEDLGSDPSTYRTNHNCLLPSDPGDSVPIF